MKQHVYERVYVIKYYTFDASSQRCHEIAADATFARYVVYEPHIWSSYYFELNFVQLEDGTVEYVERSNTSVSVYKEIPNHWLVRALSAVETG